MATDWSTFNPADAAALIQTLEGELGSVATDWWNENKGVVGGDVERLAKAAIETRAALAEGRIPAAAAATALADQQSSLNDVIKFTEFMTLVLAERVKDTIFKAVGWAIYNRTGINLFPDLVQPAA